MICADDVKVCWRTDERTNVCHDHLSFGSSAPGFSRAVCVCVCVCGKKTVFRVTSGHTFYMQKKNAHVLRRTAAAAPPPVARWCDRAGDNVYLNHPRVVRAFFCTLLKFYVFSSVFVCCFPLRCKPKRCEQHKKKVARLRDNYAMIRTLVQFRCVSYHKEFASVPVCPCACVYVCVCRSHILLLRRGYAHHLACGVQLPSLPS